MFFRNLSFFRFPLAQSKTFEQLDDTLADCRLKPVGPLDAMSRGFISPFGRDEPVLSHRIGHAIWLTLGGEDRLLPAAVVNDALGKKIAAIEAKDGRKLGGRARKRLKEDLVHEMLPKAFVKPVRLDGMLDLQQGVVVVDTSSRKAAEGFVTELRHALGSFPAVPLNAEASARIVLTGWIAGEFLPAGLVLGDECELKDPGDRGAVVRCTRQDLTGEEIGKHLESGKQVTRLALTLEDRLSFVLGDDLVVRKLKFLEGAVESLDGSERDSLHAELDARFALMAAELAQLFALLEQTFKLSKPE